MVFSVYYTSLQVALGLIYIYWRQASAVIAVIAAPHELINAVLS